MTGITGRSGRSVKSGSSGFIGSIPDGKKTSNTAKELYSDFNQEGFNDHELDAMEVDYIDRYFEHYLPLKQKLLEMRKKAVGDNEKVYCNYLRILTYTVFENSWLVYLMTGDHQISFSKNDGALYDNPYHNHLPSFSSALLHIGSSIDQFFVLINLFNEKKVTSPADFDGVLRVYFRGKNNEVKYHNVLNNISKDPIYFKKGDEIKELNGFRNYFAHQVRILWEHRDSYKKLYYFPRDLYDKIMDNGGYGKQEVFNMLIDTRQYEKKIQATDVRNVISSKDIIVYYHDEMTSFFNLTFSHMLNKL